MFVWFSRMHGDGVGGELCPSPIPDSETASATAQVSTPSRLGPRNARPIVRAEGGRRQHELVSCCAIAALATTFFLEKCERH